MKTYTRPELDISLFNAENIVTVSGTKEYTNALTTWQSSTGGKLINANIKELAEITKYVF